MNGWSSLERFGEAGHEALYAGEGFFARLLFDCHGEARKFEVELENPSQFPYQLLEYLKPFGIPRVVSPGQLVLIDRAGYFRLYLIPGRLQALLRKAAPLSVLGELVAQIERAMTNASCPHCPSVCPEHSISYPAGSFTVDDATCTRCLECVRHHGQVRHTPPALPAREAEDL